MTAYPSAIVAPAAPTPAQRLQRSGGEVLRWSLVLLLVVFGALKWTEPEAAGIRPFIVHSPFLWWIDRAFGQQGASEFIGVIELATAALIAVRRWAPKLALVGGVLGIVTFLTTLSFIATTPNIGGGAAFLMKDVTLLGAAMWVAGEAWAAVANDQS